MSGGWTSSLGLVSMDDFGGLAGTTITPSATINTLGSWISMGTLTTDCSMLKIGINYNNSGQSDYAMQMDIGIGTTGNQIVYIPAIAISLQPAGLGQSAVYEHLFPVSLPEGTQIWARSAINRASFTGTLKLWVSSFTSGYDAGIDFGGYETLGNIGPGRGTVVTGGVNQSGNVGSYVLIGTTSRDWAGFILDLDLAHNATNESGSMIDIAINSTQNIILPKLFIYQGGVESPSDFEFYPVSVPEGTPFYARAYNVAPAVTFGLTIHGAIS